MSFAACARWLWLAAKRAGCNRDVRRYLLRHFRDVSLDVWREERAHHFLEFFLADRCDDYFNCMHELQLRVDSWGEDNNEAYCLGTVLMRIMGRRNAPLIRCWRRIVYIPKQDD